MIPYIPSMPAELTRIQKSLLYASKTLLGGFIAWYGLQAAGVENPIWAVITVMLVSDPDFNTSRDLAIARIINTVIGCSIGLFSLTLFGYSPLASLFTMAFTVLCVTSIPQYPTNWRLAPVTVLILLDAGRQAANHVDEIHYALLRGGEIGIGCCIAMLLAMLYTRLVRLITAPPVDTAPTE
jgi:uncharacterized membrane protein YccC